MAYFDGYGSSSHNQAKNFIKTFKKSIYPNSNFGLDNLNQILYIVTFSLIIGVLSIVSPENLQRSGCLSFLWSLLVKDRISDSQQSNIKNRQSRRNISFENRAFVRDFTNPNNVDRLPASFAKCMGPQCYHDSRDYQI